MKIAITDANVFIDLIYVDFHSHLFALDFEIHTSLEVYDELNESQQIALRKFIGHKKLAIHNGFEISPVKEIQSIKGLSESDKTVLHLAIQLNAFVLTGDSLIRKISGVQKIEVHGMFWLFDIFLEKNLITKKHACQQLRSLMSYNKRLPLDECEKRLALWEN